MIAVKMTELVILKHGNNTWENLKSQELW